MATCLSDMSKTWRILSIDGGGIRGIIPAVLLEQIEYGTGKHISDLFDFIAGTSSGAITALALGTPETTTDGKPTPHYRADDIIDLYFHEGPKIFAKRPFQEIEEWAFGGAKHDAQAIERSLAKYFGVTRLGQSLTNVMVPAYCLEQRTTVFFKSWDKNNCGQFLMKDIARATSAAPTYFIPARLNTPEGPLGFIDGGLVSNNPTMTALVECLRYAAPGDKFWVLSLGTGRCEQPYKYSSAIHWRPVDWIKPTIDICMDGSDAKTDYELLQLSRSPELTYYRFDTILPSQNASLDKASPNNMKMLRQLGERMIKVEMPHKFEQMLSDLLHTNAHTKTLLEWQALSPRYQPFTNLSNTQSTNQNIAESGQR